MPTKKFLIISIAVILGSTVFNYVSLGDMSKYQRSNSPSSRSFGGSRSGGGYSSGGWHK